MNQPLNDKIMVTQPSGDQTRYVAKMGLSVGDYYEESGFTLAGRSKMTLPILVGRNYFDNSLLVRTSDKNRFKLDCEEDLAALDN
ncbi:MAG: hypothetical protein R3341_08645 [Methylophaga sp.]|nr:hypothetical protein [Methylophaga sp.]